MPKRLILGTFNGGKVRELVSLLAPLSLKLLPLAEFPPALNVAETGDSFAANARLKAVEQARHLEEWVLGEDSGLVVDALGGAPGIYSARFAGPSATDELNNQKLLAMLADVPIENRTAHYVCHLTLADRHGGIRAEASAICRGRILRQAEGTAGFGYDPLFEIVEYHRSNGVLGEGVKSVLSHRARAVRLILPQIEALLDEWEVD